MKKGSPLRATLFFVDVCCPRPYAVFKHRLNRDQALAFSLKYMPMRLISSGARYDNAEYGFSPRLQLVELHAKITVFTIGAPDDQACNVQKTALAHELRGSLAGAAIIADLCHAVPALG